VHGERVGDGDGEGLGTHGPTGELDADTEAVLVKDGVVLGDNEALAVLVKEAVDVEDNEAVLVREAVEDGTIGLLVSEAVVDREEEAVGD